VTASVVNSVRIIQVGAAGLPLDGPTDIHVVGGRIAAVGSAPGTVTERFDGGGRYALPGLVNAHDHLYSKELRFPDPGMDIRVMRALIDTRGPSATLAVMLRNAWASMAEGVLVVRDLGARHGVNTDLARIIADGIVPGPAIVPAGRPIVMTGGHVWTFGREADGPDECRRAVREQRKAGAQVIKVMASGGVSNYPHEDYKVCEFTDDELVAIASEAKKLGLPTCAHAYGEDAVAAAVKAGIDGIEHGVHLGESTIAAMVAAGTSYVPTMANMQRIASPEMNQAAGVPERSEVFTREIVEPQRRSVARAIDAGVRIGVGTDSTGFYLDELRELRTAGMNVEQLIRSATIEGAKICRVPAGVIEPGRLALFSLYEQDPREDLDLLVAPSAVFCSGALFEVSEIKRLVTRS
jgi:imidazolonepropionase-like amidohydrolase